MIRSELVIVDNYDGGKTLHLFMCPCADSRILLSLCVSLWIVEAHIAALVLLFFFRA